MKAREMVMIVVLCLLIMGLLYYREENGALKNSCLKLEEELKESKEETDNVLRSYYIEAERAEIFKEHNHYLEAENAQLNWELERRIVEVKEYDVTWSDICLIAEISRLEAGNKEEGQKAVVKVIKNRIESDRFPDSVQEVIYQPGQFSTARLIKGKVDDSVLLNTLEVFIEDYDMPDDVLFFHADNGDRSKKVYDVIDGNVFTF